jgi:hypothetical protein
MLRSALAFPDFDMSDPTRGICGPAAPTATLARPEEPLQSRRAALIAKLAGMHRNDARRSVIYSTLRDLTTDCLREGK